MKVRLLLDIPKKIHAAVWSHLLPNSFSAEEAAFLFTVREHRDRAEIFKYLEWLPVPPEGFHFRSRYHFELTDGMRGRVIKRAHDLNASLVELHSHAVIGPAQFSPSDLSGFLEFVPHVWWRLKGRPYLAIVVSRSSFDGFVWNNNPKKPERLDAIVVEKSILKPTKISSLRIKCDGKYERKTLRS